MSHEELGKINKAVRRKAFENPKEVRRKIPIRDESASYKRVRMDVMKDIEASIDRESLNETQVNHVNNFIIYATLQDIKMKYRGLAEEDIYVFLKLEKDQDLVDNFTDEYPEYFA